MVTNTRVVDTDGDDFYPTPAWATHALMLNEKFEGSIWEPACGDGEMAEVIKLYTPGQNIFCTDLYDHGYGAAGTEFISSASRKDIQINNIITNPPYNIANDFVAKALEVADKKVAMLLRLAYLEGQERYDTLYSVTPPTRVWVFSERITFYKKGATKKGSGTTAYGWFVWDKEDSSKKTELKWLPPIYKKRIYD
jgi:hypothetical protein